MTVGWPVRKVVDTLIDEEGMHTDILECGHTTRIYRPKKASQRHQRHRRHCRQCDRGAGSVSPVKQGKWPRPPLEVRFWKKVNKTDGCWLWTGHTNYSGYGVLKIGGADKRAHRVSWELAHGPVPEPLLVLHRCDVRNCVNPSHLFLGTQQHNLEDCRLKDRVNRNLKKAWITRRSNADV